MYNMVSKGLNVYCVCDKVSKGLKVCLVYDIVCKGLNMLRVRHGV